MSESMENGGNSQMTEEDCHAGCSDSDNVYGRNVREPLRDTDSSGGRPRIRLRSVSQLDKSKQVPQLVKGVFTQGQPAMLHGRSQSAKSFLLADLSKAIAIDQPFFGRPVTPGCVLYVPFEGEGTFGTRMHAIADGMAPDEYELYDQRFAMMQDSQPFLLGDKGMRAANEVIVNAGALEDRSGEPVRLIVLDTMFAALPGCSVNDDSVMTHALNLANQIAKATGAVPLFAHHPGHTNQHRMIGSSSAIGGFNTILRVQVNATRDTIAIRSDEPRSLILDKWKDGNCDVVLGTFNLRVVPIGVDDQDGLPVTSCTINVIELGSSGDASAKRSQRPKLNSKESRCRDNLTRLYEQKKDLSVPGTDIGIPDADVGERWRVIKLSDLKDACRKGKLTIAPEGDTPANESDREYQAFKHAIEALDTKHKLIGRYDDYVWDLEINRKRGRHNLSTVRYRQTRHPS
jgi:hypothetical protein